MGKGKAHYIEVLYDEEDDEETSCDQGEIHDSPKEEQPQSAVQKDESPPTEAKKAVITTLSGVCRYHTFRIKGVVQGHQITSLIDSGATHNFIDAALANMKGISTEEFKGFNVEVADGYTLECTHMIRGLHVTLGNYTLTDDFYVVDLVDIMVAVGGIYLHM
jgi:predicted aspartyl protease